MRRLLYLLLTLALITMSGYFLVDKSRDSISEVNERPAQLRTSGAMEALTFWTRSRAYPEKDIPAAKYFAERQKDKQKLNRLSSYLDISTTWEAIGPYNVPGRMISVAVNPLNPRTLYVGTASGGLWRTFNAETGENWQRVTTGYPTLGVMAIAIDPADTNTIFIGTGEVYGYQKSIGGTVIRTTRGSYGIGILKTSDSGQSWMPSLDWTRNQERGVQCIRINPQNPSSIYAATTEGIYKSTDAGSAWKLVLPVIMGEDIVIHPDDTSKVIVSCGNLGSSGTGLYRTVNAGQNWTKLTGIPSYSGKTLLDAYAANPNTVFASVADSIVWDANEEVIGLWRTDNFGESWYRVHNYNVPRYQGWFSHWVAVHPTDLTQVVHAGVYIFKSYDSGGSLDVVGGIHVDHHNYTHDPVNPDVLYAVCDGGIYRSNDFGDSYYSIGYGLQSAQFYNGFSSSAGDSSLALGGLQDNNVVLFDGTKDWTRVTGGDGCWTAINSFNDNILYAETQRNSIKKSVNRGRSFSQATNGMSDSDAAFVAPFVISPSNPYILYSGRRKVFKTTDNADSWYPTNNNSELDGNRTLSMAISARNSDVVYVGTAPDITRAHVFRTTNGGNSWVNITGPLPDRYPTDLAVDHNDDQTVYTVFGGFGSGHVFKSTNGGDNWNDITGTLPDVPTFAVVIDPFNSEHVYVGNDLGVYVSTNAGLSWNTFNSGLPEAVIAMDLNISPTNHMLRVATHGNGAYQRSLLYQPPVHLVYKFDPIPNVVLSGSIMSFQAVVTNYGFEAQSDLITATVRILDDINMELYTSSVQFDQMQPKESRKIIFDGTFKPLDTGDYTFEFIKFGTSQQSRQDTTRQILQVITSPSIALTTVSKVYYPYEEITRDEPLPPGDDIQAPVDLPFTFVYDAFVYDKIQVSSNGWLEFGTGQDGSERGLSTESQIGGSGSNSNGSLASTTRPSKTLGPWWEDLTAVRAEYESGVSYQTIGSAPNRVFVVQWKNMLAYYDASQTTTRVNFQVRMYESTNIIEYHYGPVVQGTFGGSGIGAMIGFEDHIGGDYHFYDIMLGGIALSAEVVTDLSPLTDWPGPDSCFMIQTMITSSEQEVPNDWTIPVEISLYQNYPNPFNPQTTIQFDLPSPSEVTIKVFNIQGQLVKSLLVDQLRPAGPHRVVWDGKNKDGMAVSSGVYFYKLETESFRATKKMMLIR